MSSLTFKFVISAILWSLGFAAPLEEKAENRSKTKGSILIVSLSHKFVQLTGFYSVASHIGPIQLLEVKLM